MRRTSYEANTFKPVHLGGLAFSMDSCALGGRSGRPGILSRANSFTTSGEPKRGCSPSFSAVPDSTDRTFSFAVHLGLSYGHRNLLFHQKEQATIGGAWFRHLGKCPKHQQKVSAQITES